MRRACLWTLTMIAASVAVPPLSGYAQELPASHGPMGTVTLPRTDYDRLLDLAGRNPGRPDAPPLAAALTRADIRVRVDRAVARATMRIDGQVLRAGIVKVPLIRRATLLEARLADAPLPIVADGDMHSALLSGPSTFSATLDVGMPLSNAPGRGSFFLPVPPAGSATATIDIPGDQADVHLSAGLVLRRASANGRTLVDVTLDPGSNPEVWWSTRDSVPTVPARDARILADVKTLVTIGEPDVRLLTLMNITVVQGEPSRIDVDIPAGYEVTSVSGATVDRTEPKADGITVFVTNPAQRRHQCLISLERQTAGGSFKLQTGFPAVPTAQRETGEIAVEGIGTLDLSSGDIAGLRRVDVREVDPALASAARQSLLAAYRYQRVVDVPVVLSLDVRRFPDAAVLAAIAERAVVTTLVTSEGRALTEVVLWVRNRAQPFVKIALPAGASMLSAEVAGAPAKPVEAKDGDRVPLLRPGFRPDGPYMVSFVYLHAGAPFAKKGDMQMTLPKMDLPIDLVEWELFVPDQYRADRFDGNVLNADLINRSGAYDRISVGYGSGVGSGLGAAAPATAGPGQIVGRIVDQQGAALPGVTVVAEGSQQRQSAVTDANGAFVLSGLPSGPIAVTGQLAGFAGIRRSLIFDQRPRQVDFVMQVGGLTETVTVTAEAPYVDTDAVAVQNRKTEDRISARQRAENEPSANVQNLQRRASGVLPVRIEVPRAGSSHRFFKPLVIDEETIVTFRYKRR
ncbi:MAG: hypothetical protein DMF84_21055 [Acidobacteria bacterium]|nr:MAG: hypothetical protein DMF84_21055 [Acidobacteriota bacterium]